MNPDVCLYFMGRYGARYVIFLCHYKGWRIYREWDVVGDCARASYFACHDDMYEPLHAHSLDDIKAAVSSEAVE